MLCVATLLITGCAGQSTKSPLITFKRTQLHMGTLVTITVLASDQTTGDLAMQVGFNEIKRLEKLLSTWRPESELSRVNAKAGHEPIQVSRETLELVIRSLELAQLTDGGFNIALGPAVEAWSVTEREHIPTTEELRQLKPLVDWTSIQVDRNAQTIYLPRPGMRIDVGGIGKGYAADRAVEKMKRIGVKSGVVALSGDVKAFGSLLDGEGFPVGIKHPRQEDGLIGVINLKDEAVSTAGDYERFFERDGIRYHHILGSESLQPARECQSVTIIAKEGAVADGLDTGIFVLGPEKGMALVERLPDVEAIIVDSKGKITVSSGIRHRLRTP